MMMWGFIFLLTAAVVFLIWMQFTQQKDAMTDTELNRQLDVKVAELEQHLQKTLTVMQDLAKSVYSQREQIQQNTKKMQALEQQNAELVALFAQHLKNQVDLQKHRTDQD